MTLLVTNVSSNDTVDGKPWMPGSRRVSCVHLATKRVLSACQRLSERASLREHRFLTFARYDNRVYQKGYRD